MKRAGTLLLHPLFIVSLFILLANDCYWKHEYDNWLTGKLSDFTGLIVLPLFLISFLPDHRSKIMITSGLFFIWWKSPLSQPAIDWLNENLPITVQRVVDYTDLYALAGLPVIFFIRPYNLQYVPYKKALINLSGLFCLFAFCRTSMPYRPLMYSQRENEVAYNETFISRKSKEDLLQKIAAAGYHYYADSVKYYPLRTDNLYHRISSSSDTIAVWAKVPNSQDSLLFFRKESFQKFYVFPVLVLGSDTLRNLELSFSTTGRKNNFTAVQVESFRVNEPMYDWTYGKKKRELKRRFKKVFEE